MRSLAELLITLLDLFEAEGRSLRRSVVRLTISMMVVAIAGLVLLGAIGFILAGVYLYFESLFGAAPAAFLAGAASLVVAGITVWGAKRSAR